MSLAVLTALIIATLAITIGLIIFLAWKLTALSVSGEKELESKKKLIDQNLLAISQELKEVQGVMRNLERDGESKFSHIKAHLETAAKETARLRETTGQLKMALADTRARGQWGERMAEDILKVSGLIEGINYYRQRNLEKAGGRPDFTFILPKNRKLNMDVKFSCDNYLKFLESRTDDERQRYKTQFLRDVRGRIKEVTTRDYINPEENTVDYVIVFVPNEQIYAFIHENDRSILDDALKNKVILSSPLTLYAILAVIRQAVESFQLEKATSRILSLFGAFNKQWAAFTFSLDKMGKRIDDAKKEFDDLTQRRRKALERPLKSIEGIRKQRGISAQPISRIPDCLEEEGEER